MPADETPEGDAAPAAAAEEPEATDGGAAAYTEEAAVLLARLEAELGDAVIETGCAVGDAVVRVRPDAWQRAARVCKERLDCDYLSFVAGIDWLPAPAAAEGSGDTSTPAQPREMTFGVAGAAGRFQVFARVASTYRPRWGVTLKVDVDEAEPHAESWVPVYPGADWHERECWEMYGIAFDGHPGLRKLYLPAEFEGHPLRKDFPLLAREVKPWPGLVDVEGMPGAEGEGGEGAESSEGGDA